jgi:large subunit ribosomal protein L22
MKAVLSHYRQSPRKVRLVTDLVRGKSVSQAESLLATLPKRAALPVLKLLNSAVANAKAQGLDPKNLYVQKATVNQGVVLKRFRPRAFGRAYLIRKKTSQVAIGLAEKKTPVKKKEKETKEKKDKKNNK